MLQMSDIDQAREQLIHTAAHDSHDRADDDEPSHSSAVFLGPELKGCYNLKFRVYLCFAVGLLLNLVAGTLYGFSTYAQEIKKRLNYDQPGIELVGSLGNLGTYLGPLTGTVMDVFGSRKTIFVGMLCLFSGYLFMYLGVDGLLTTHHAIAPAGLGLTLFFVGLGSSFYYAASLKTNINNFHPRHRGSVVAVLVSGFGISAFIFAELYSGYFNSTNLTSYLRFCAFVITACGVIGFIFVVPIKRSFATLTAEEFVAKNGCSCVTLAEIWANVKVLLQNTFFWLLFFTFLLGTGGGLFHINNVGNVIKSLNNGVEDHPSVLRAVTLISFGNCGGRLFMGLSDFTRCRRGVYVIIALVTMATAHMLNAFLVTSIDALYYTSFFVGLAYGGLWSIFPTMVSEAFGIKFFAQNFGWVGLAPAISSPLFNAVAGALYDDQIHGGGTNCEGVMCYRYAFLFASIASLVGCVVAVFMIPRTYHGRRTHKPIAH